MASRTLLRTTADAPTRSARAPRRPAADRRAGASSRRRGAATAPAFRVVASGPDCVDAWTGPWTSDARALQQDVDDALGAGPGRILVERRPQAGDPFPVLVAAGMEGRGATVPRFFEGLRCTPPRYSSDWG
jgi:hypothetical protein